MFLDKSKLSDVVGSYIRIEAMYKGRKRPKSEFEGVVSPDNFNIIKFNLRKLNENKKVTELRVLHITETATPIKGMTTRKYDLFRYRRAEGQFALNSVRGVSKHSHILTVEEILTAATEWFKDEKN